jgi:hypothetical protein
MADVISELASIDWPADQIDTQVKAIVGEFAARKKSSLRARLKEALRRAEAEGDQKRADELIVEMKRLGL